MAGQGGIKRSKATADYLQSALTQRKRSQILSKMVVVRPDLAHITWISPGHPAVNGQCKPGSRKELVREEGVTFLSFKVLIYILTSN